MADTWQNKDGRRARGETSRRAIVEAAVACIAENGLCDTTLDRVAEGANVSRSLVIFHFKSKDGLLIDVLNYLGADYTKGWDAALSDDGAPTSERLFRLLEFDLRFALERPDIISVWQSFWGEAKGSTLYREVAFPRDQGYMKDLADLLQLLANEGGYTDVEPATIETGIWSMTLGLWLEAHLNPDLDIYTKGLDAINAYLQAVFPRHFPLAMLDAQITGST